MDLIYLDYNATTPCAPEVIETMLPYFNEKFGNAGSVTHILGKSAATDVKLAREKISEYLNCDAEEIYFTSGATEGCNIAIQGVYHAYKHKGNEIICITTEHKAVIDTCVYLEQYHGAKIHWIPVDKMGNITIDDLLKNINSKTILICAMMANNETGTVNNVEEIGQLARENNILFFCDASQAVGKINIDLNKLPIDILVASGHKIYAPKGIGFLFLKRKKPRVTIIPIINGGGQERGKRSGTLNVPGIMGLRKAIELSYDRSWLTKIEDYRNQLEQSILSIHKEFCINGNLNNRLPNVSNIALTGIKAERLLGQINHNLCISLGSACAAAQQGPSHVLQAMQLTKEQLDGSIRISLGRYTTYNEIEKSIDILSKAIISQL